jgi:pimeloyl-ACP methyl ester carboxylesterase
VNKLVLFSPAGFEYYLPHEASLFKSAIILGDFMNMDELHISNAINTAFFQSSDFSKQMIKDLHGFIQHNDRRLYRLMMERCMNAMLDEQLFPQLKKIQQPTLAFFGENDMLIPNRFLHPISTQELAERAVLEMPQGELKMYSLTGHYVMIERFLEVNTFVRNWLLN